MWRFHFFTQFSERNNHRHIFTAFFIFFVWHRNWFQTQFTKYIFFYLLLLFIKIISLLVKISKRIAKLLLYISRSITCVIRIFCVAQTISTIQTHITSKTRRISKLSISITIIFYDIKKLFSSNLFYVSWSFLYSYLDFLDIAPKQMNWCKKKEIGCWNQLGRQFILLHVFRCLHVCVKKIKSSNISILSLQKRFGKNNSISANVQIMSLV